MEAAPGKSGLGSGKFSFEGIRESLRHLRNTSGNVDQKGSDSMPLSAFKNSLKLGSVDQNKGSWSSRIGGESEKLPASIFGKEMRQRNEGAKPVSTAMKTEFVKIYSYKELGDKLRQLRPEGKMEGKNWFSLGELNERLVKLRENEENETKSSNISGISFNDLRDSLLTLKMSDDAKAKQSMIQRLDVLSHFGSTPSFMLDPPKEQLVEKFFHPDNMSSAEKMKIELQKVRDEFKMSESDCGSARVQVAQLTTKIKHLSTALHKKDKHSRKGLQEMVQKRKKLLKYLRRTDWDSYCFVLSRLGLRDNPGYKAT